jgi:site-specific DNA-methyltransferase (adenine-specific)
VPEVINAECLQAMAEMADNCVDAIITDPPYFKVKNEAWDRQWDKPDQFIAWIGKLCEEWQRILKPNGSVYVFASPKMATKVEVEVGRWFNVLTRVVWRKPPFSTKAEMFRKEDLRSFFPASESVIFAEHFGADNMAKGEAGYVAKCDELRGFVFEPLRAYLDGERDRAGWTTRRVAEEYQKKTGSRTVTGMAGHWFGTVQWALPTDENYNWLRALFSANDGEYLRREYEYLRREYEYLRREYEDLRREYEDLRREYEDLRRPFSVTADVPYTDVWDFKTVAHYPGKHPCEKPAALMEHIVSASTRPGAVVLDCFMGTGSTGIACQKLGREFIGIEMSPEYCTTASKRLAVKHLF